MRYSEEEKAMWLSDWAQSGKSYWAYAKANGLNMKTFKNWTREKEKTENRQCFVEIPPSPMSMQVITPIREILIEKGDVKIHIPLSVSVGELRAVMEGLGAVL
jgi:transposase-like protein